MSEARIVYAIYQIVRDYFANRRLGAWVFMPENREEKARSTQYSYVHPMARIAGVLATSTLEAYATYPLDVLKNRQMMGKEPGQSAPEPLSWWQHMIGPELGERN